jgi:hypothetical protein
MIFRIFRDTSKYSPDLLRLMAAGFLELHWKTKAFGQEHSSRFSSSESLAMTKNSDR